MRTMTDDIRKRIELFRDNSKDVEIDDLWAAADTMESQQARIELLEEALAEIAKGEGAYSHTPLQHAENAIESMVDIADKAIAACTDSKGTEEKTCAGCGNKWNHDSVWCPECALKRAVDFATSIANDEPPASTDSKALTGSDDGH